MIRKYSFGRVPNTDAVVAEVPESRGEVPYFRVERGLGEGREKSVRLSISLGEEEILFGLGETVRGQNKRGHRYESWNSDVFNHTEEKPSLYASHNLLIFFGAGRLFGLYLDDPGRVIWDLGWTRQDRAEIISENGDFDLYLIEEKSLKETARAFRRLTGRSYIPPRWAFGYIQSRWGYASEEEVTKVVEEHRRRHIPLDSLCLDIDYMDDFKNFTWRKDAFPDLKKFNKNMKGQHIHLIPIIDAGIRQEEGYGPYDSGKAREVFCTREDGSDFSAAVWPGMCCFPDFLRPEAREWFGGLYRPLLEEGIEGFWNDMNEPALFYTEEGIERAFASARERMADPTDFEGMWNVKDAFNSMANNLRDYRSFYHRTEEGKRICHERVHNLYGAGMTRATAEGFRAFDPERRFLLFSRSSFIGAHRNGGVWMGDNFSWWSHLSLALHMLPGLNMCGFLYCGCDLGGFGCDVTEDLMERFLQLGVFLPLMRNHSALHTREQEVYRFSTWETMRDTITVRYALIPYLYSEFMKAALTDGMLFRPLAFDYPEDSRAIRTEDQLMLGGECMIAPICEQNARGRYVYLPEDMLMLRFRSGTDWDEVPLEKGDHYVSMGPGEFPLFIRRGCFIPLCGGGEYTEELDEEHLRMPGWDAEGAVYELYRDDGLGTKPELAGSLTRLRRDEAAF